MAVDGGHVLVGANLDNDAGINAGTAFLYDAATGAELFKFEPDGGVLSANFGGSVALANGRAVVGASGDLGESFLTGAAYVYDVATGVRLDKLQVAGGVAADAFGRSIAVSGDLAVVGAPGDSQLGSDAGAAYVFDLNTGAQLFKLLPDDGTEFDSFGSAVATDGVFAVVGASTKSAGGVAFAGAAYVFDLATGAQVHRLFPAGDTIGTRFGSAVAIDGSVAVVGAPIGAESVHVFDLVSGAQTTTLRPAGSPGPVGRLGESVAADNGLALVGAEQGLATSGLTSGVTYSFKTDSSPWINAGGALAGASTPFLNGCGPLVLNGTLALDVASAPANAPAILVVGASTVSLPLFGGTLVPFPDLVLSGFGTDANGALELSASVQVGVPPGSVRVAQYWFVDASGPFGLIATNAVSVTN